ncbi:MAG: type II toxin-antitoxin system RelE/ParE family toxin [Candidatus Peregrinibacteria bacterium]
MTYRIVITKQAAKDMKKLSADMRKRVDAAIDVLRENPLAGKQLRGELEGMWSLRVWPYRIIYTIHREIVTVSVLRVGHRQGVYQ